MFDIQIADDDLFFLAYRKSIEKLMGNFPRTFMRDKYGVWGEPTRLSWFKARYKCCKYPLYLAGFVEEEKVGDPNLPKDYTPILGMDFQSNPHELLFQQFVRKRPGEGVVLADLDTEIKKRMILWSRGVYKTSAVRVDIVQTILNYPNVRICFLTGSEQLAKLQLAAIKRYFESPSERFKMLFPEYCLKSVRNRHVSEDEADNAWTDQIPRMGTKHEFTVPCRTNTTFVEPTFAISTARAVKAGSHYDFIFIDDLVNETNYRSITALEKCYQDYKDVCPVLDPTGYIVMTGTRYSFGDTYERIQDAARQEEKELGKTIWQFSIRSCWTWGCKNCTHTDVYHDSRTNKLHPLCGDSACGCPGFESNGTKGLLFPATRTWDGRPIGHTFEFLAAAKIELGEEGFANQYENEPIAAGAQVFTETLIGAQTIFDSKMIPAYAASFTFIVGDLAYIGQPGRDFSVLYACRKFQGQLFVIDCLYGNWDSAGIAENTIRMMLIHKPKRMYYEKFNGWEAYNTVITIDAAAKGVTHVPLEWVKYSQAPNAKLTRIGSVKGPLSNRRLWLYAMMGVDRGLPDCYERTIHQLTKWPKLGKHDDFADCMGMVVAAPTGYEQETPPVITTSLNWLRRLNQMPEDGEDNKPYPPIGQDGDDRK